MTEPDTDRLSISFRNRDLCSRCGTCIGVCPVNALSIGEDRFKALDAERCISCGRCRQCCPGGRVSYSDLTQLTFGGNATDPDDFDGTVLDSCLAHATDDALRNGGARAATFPPLSAMP